MRAAFARGGAGIDAIAFREVEIPKAGPGEALVRMTAATLNYRDLIMAKGLMGPGMTKEPEYIPISCATGIVVEVAPGVTRVAAGDRVNPLFAQNWIDGPANKDTMLGASMDGVAQHFAVYDAESLCVVPDSLSDLEAATLPCAGLTAWSALFHPRPIQPGEWVLAPGTGGVSIAALQLAKAAGAKVIVTSSSEAKLARATALGADAIVNYRSSADWVAETRDATRGGVDMVIDVVGQNGLPDFARLIRPGGIITAIGMLDGAFSWSAKEIDGVPIIPIGVGNRHRHEAMLAFVAQHAVRPVVDMVYDLERLPDALRRLESGAFFGKIGINLL